MIRIAAYKGKSWVSKGIRWQTWSDYSHVAIILGTDEIIEAWQGSDEVRVIKNLSDGHSPGTEVDVYSVPMTFSQEIKFKKVARSLVGAEYDYAGIAGFLVRQHFENSEKYFCSELFAHCCKETGLDYFRYIDAHKVSPGRSVLGHFDKLHTIRTV